MLCKPFPLQRLSLVLLQMCHHLQNVSYSDTCVVCLLSPTAIFPFRNCIHYFKRVKHYPFCRLPFSGIKRSTPPDTFPLMRARSTDKRKNAPYLLYFVLSSTTTSPWFAFMVPGLNRCTLLFIYFLEEPSSSQCYFRMFVGILVICSFSSPPYSLLESCC